MRHGPLLRSSACTTHPRTPSPRTPPAKRPTSLSHAGRRRRGTFQQPIPTSHSPRPSRPHLPRPVHAQRSTAHSSPVQPIRLARSPVAVAGLTLPARACHRGPGPHPQLPTRRCLLPPLLLAAAPAAPRWCRRRPLALLASSPLSRARVVRGLPRHHCTAVVSSKMALSRPAHAA
jgi:hypothetical protein